MNNPNNNTNTNPQNSCQFCKILTHSNSTPTPTPLLYKDPQIFAFHDIDKSSARQHILVCTTAHIQTALDIKSKQILYKMRQIGTMILSKISGQVQGSTNFRFGFHLRPYISIDHIHLHCFLLPFKEYVKDKIVYGRLLYSVEDICGRMQQENKIKAKL